MARGHRDVTEQAFRMVDFTADDRVLDVGCGIGWAADLAGSLGAGRTFGVDISPAMVSRGGARLVAGSATALPFRDGAFTKLVSVESIYYYGDIDTALGEFRRVAADGARCVCVIDLYGDNPGAHAWVPALDVDVHLFTAAEWSDRFRAAGFREVATRQIVDRRPVDTEDAFEPSRWFPTYADYRTYRELGALMIDAIA